MIKIVSRFTGVSFPAFRVRVMLTSALVAPALVFAGNAGAQTAAAPAELPHDAAVVAGDALIGSVLGNSLAISQKTVRGVSCRQKAHRDWGTNWSRLW